MIERALFFMLTLAVLHASAQDRDTYKHDLEQFEKAKMLVIKTPQPSGSIQFHHIHSFKVVDARPDTMRIGFVRSYHKFTCATVEKSLRSVFHQFISAYAGFIQRDTAPDVLLVIRKCWMTDMLDTVVGSKMPGPLREDTIKWESGIVIKLEFYLRKNDKYFPLYRYEHVSTDPTIFKDYFSAFLKMAISSSLATLKKYDDDAFDGVASRKALDEQMIMAFDRSAFDLPVLKDKKYRTGVYLSFEEFRNNAPSIDSFRVIDNELNDQIYIKDSSGNEYVTRKLWGYSDGKNVFIYSADNFFPLIRKQNAFYFIGAKNIGHHHSNSTGLFPTAPGDPFHDDVPNTAIMVDRAFTKKYHIELCLLQLDLDDGEIY